VITYLSAEWIDRLRELAVADESLAEISQGMTMTLQQVVTDAPWGTATYYLHFDDAIYVQAGEASQADVTFTQDWTTSVGVATGEINALDAFRDGRVELTGDPTVLSAAQPVFQELDRVFTALRAETVYE